MYRTLDHSPLHLTVKMAHLQTRKWGLKEAPSASPSPYSGSLPPFSEVPPGQLGLIRSVDDGAGPFCGPQVSAWWGLGSPLTLVVSGKIDLHGSFFFTLF